MEKLRSRRGRGSANLTQDALAEVFSRLPFQELLTSVPLVCKDWHNASLDPACWRKVDMQPWFEKRAKEEHLWKFECEPKIEFLVKKVVDRSCGQLRELRTMHCSNAAIEYIAENCHSLIVISIVASPLVSDESAAKLAANSPKLEWLDISHCYNLSSASLEAFGRNCKFLVWLARNMLHVYSVYFLEALPKEIAGSDDEEAIAVSKYLVNLKHLEMKRTRLSDVGVWHLARGCRRLESLNLDACTELSSKALGDFHKFCPNLREFTKPITRRMSFNKQQRPVEYFNGFF